MERVFVNDIFVEIDVVVRLDKPQHRVEPSLGCNWSSALLLRTNFLFQNKMIQKLYYNYKLFLLKLIILKTNRLQRQCGTGE